MANFFSLLTEIFGIKLSRASAEEENLFDHPTAAELHEEERRQQVKCSVAKAQQIFPSTCLIWLGFVLAFWQILLRAVDPDDEKRAANATIDVEGSGWNALAGETVWRFNDVHYIARHRSVFVCTWIAEPCWANLVALMTVCGGLVPPRQIMHVLGM